MKETGKLPEWAEKFVIFDGAWHFFLGLSNAFRLLGIGANGNRVCKAAPKDAEELVDMVKSYAQAHPDSPRPIHALPEKWETFKRLCAFDDSARARAEAVKESADCMAYHALLGADMEAAVERKRIEAEADARVEKANLAAFVAGGKLGIAKAEAKKLEKDRDDWKARATWNLEWLAVQGQRIEEKVDQATAAAQGARSAAIRAEAAAKGRKRERIFYADLVETFKAVDEKAKAHGGAAILEDVRDTMQEAREAEKMIGKMDTKKFLEMRGKWMEWGRKDAATFEKRWKAYRRNERPRKGKG